MIRVKFRRLEDVDDREKFLSLPTSFHLSDQQIDELIAAARQLLLTHPEFKRLIQDLGG